MDWITEHAGDRIVARPAGKIDETNWQDFSDRLVAAVGQAKGAGVPLTLDLSQVPYMSSRGLRALTLARKEASDAVAITLAHPTPRMREILAISRYDKIFTVVEGTAP